MKAKGKTTGGKKAVRLKDLVPSAKVGTRVTGGLRQKKQVTKVKWDTITFS